MEYLDHMAFVDDRLGPIAEAIVPKWLFNTWPKLLSWVRTGQEWPNHDARSKSQIFYDFDNYFLLFWDPQCINWDLVILEIAGWAYLCHGKVPKVVKGC